MAELTATEKLVEARAALHQLLTGKKLVSVGYGERRVQYTQADIAELRAYIAELVQEIGGIEAEKQRRRPMRVVW